METKIVRSISFIYALVVLFHQNYSVLSVCWELVLLLNVNVMNKVRSLQSRPFSKLSLEEKTEVKRHHDLALDEASYTILTFVDSALSLTTGLCWM